MRVAIVGSRQYTNKKRIQEFIFKLKQKYGDELEIVSGGQKDGAEGYAKIYAIEFDIKYLEKYVAYFEPRVALDGGSDGFSKITKVIIKASTLIKKNGKFILEIGFDQKIKVSNLLKRKGFYINNVLKDLAKNDRCIVSTKI